MNNQKQADEVKEEIRLSLAEQIKAPLVPTKHGPSFELLLKKALNSKQVPQELRRKCVFSGNNPSRFFYKICAFAAWADPKCFQTPS